jgi:hypothetical protein
VTPKTPIHNRTDFFRFMPVIRTAGPPIIFFMRAADPQWTTTKHRCGLWLGGGR